MITIPSSLLGGPAIVLYGWIGWAVVIAACTGIATVLSGIQGWLSARFALDLNPKLIGRLPFGKGSLGWDLWIGVPRRFKIHRRWDRPGAAVTLADGRRGAILYVVADEDTGSAMAVVQTHDDDFQAQQPEWQPLARLRPLAQQAAVPAGDS
jgi:hypothetical protein